MIKFFWEKRSNLDKHTEFYIRYEVNREFVSQKILAMVSSDKHGIFMQIRDEEPITKVPDDVSLTEAKLLASVSAHMSYPI